MHATLKDIARETGFSVNTVSRVLRGDTRLSEKTRDLINSTAISMKYVPNNMAYSLRMGSSKTISVIAGDIANPYFSIFIKGIETVMEKHGYTVLVLNSNEDEAREFNAIKTSLNKKVDGILICPVQKTTDNINYLKSLHIPFVLFGRKFEDFQTNYVIPNEKKGGYLATRHLLENGHRNILFLMANEYISSSPERLEGCKEAFLDAGIPFPIQNIYHFDVAKPDLYNLLTKNMALINSITAIVCFSDVIGHECIYLLKSLGKKVPQDISIIGFDHIQSKLLLATELTSIKSYKEITSTTVANILLERMQFDDEKYDQIVLDVDLALGETVADINP